MKELKSWRQSAEAELVRHQEDRLQAEAELAQLRLALDNEQQARTALEQEIEQTQQDMGEYNEYGTAQPAGAANPVWSTDGLLPCTASHPRRVHWASHVFKMLVTALQQVR